VCHYRLNLREKCFVGEDRIGEGLQRIEKPSGRGGMSAVFISGEDMKGFGEEMTSVTKLLLGGDKDDFKVGRAIGEEGREGS